jgi:hypothetical protein
MKRIEPGRAVALVVVMLALATGRAAPLQGQFASIERGQTVTGTLSAADPAPSTRGPFKVYQFPARAGERLTAVMRSSEFDSYLRLGREVGGITDELDADDDGGGETDARVRFTVPATAPTC